MLNRRVLSKLATRNASVSPSLTLPLGMRAFTQLNAASLVYTPITAVPKRSVVVNTASRSDEKIDNSPNLFRKPVLKQKEELAMNQLAEARKDPKHRLFVAAKIVGYMESWTMIFWSGVFVIFVYEFTDGFSTFNVLPALKKALGNAWDRLSGAKKAESPAAGAQDVIAIGSITDASMIKAIKAINAANAESATSTSSKSTTVTASPLESSSSSSSSSSSIPSFSIFASPRPAHGWSVASSVTSAAAAAAAANDFQCVVTTTSAPAGSDGPEIVEVVCVPTPSSSSSSTSSENSLTEDDIAVIPGNNSVLITESPNSSNLAHASHAPRSSAEQLAEVQAQILSAVTDASAAHVHHGPNVVSDSTGSPVVVSSSEPLFYTAEQWAVAVEHLERMIKERESAAAAVAEAAVAKAAVEEQVAVVIGATANKA